ncbi:hypothetical protein [Halodesulfovibrio sp. MK-HDV]|uniref:hypothetical protein n=1 Tax=unclassified Halodesulfovibrio TaxID=2644657 RepID=UPI00136CEFC6|nr:hypothetical protein [Halodesulfovibrio sp. MK-HDV]KAF1076243.1 hypothetical protein MKHDV_01264 [Halodesulfovibrio sp. MK-HDV]
MRLIFLLLVVYIGIGTLIFQHLFSLNQFTDAIFPGIAIGILATVIHITIKRKMSKPAEVEKDTHI